MEQKDGSKSTIQEFHKLLAKNDEIGRLDAKLYDLCIRLVNDDNDKSPELIELRTRYGDDTTLEQYKDYVNELEGLVDKLWQLKRSQKL